MELRQGHQSVQPFRTQDEYLYAMKEDLAEWFNGLYDLDIDVNNFFEQLENGIVICRHANNVQHHIIQQLGLGDTSTVGREGSPVERRRRGSSAGLAGDGAFGIYYRTNVRPGTFQSRDNISNFIAWCRNALQIPDTLLFETDDLVLRKNERNVVLCLLEVARRGSKFGLPVPVLVQLEQEIDAEIAAEAVGGSSVCNGGHGGSHSLRKRNPIKVDMKSLDELVRDVLGRCTCPDQFPMIKVNDGKYKIGDSLTMIFLRILRSHVMVRIGGGWDTLENYLNRHDPCRCQYRAGHGLLNTWSATATKEDRSTTPMTQPFAEENGYARSTPTSWNSGKTKSAEVLSFANGTSERSQKLPTSVTKAPLAFDATDGAMPNAFVDSSRRKSDGVTKPNPPEIHSSTQSNHTNDFMAGKNKRRTDTVMETATMGTGFIPNPAAGTTNRARHLVVSPLHRRAQSTERQPRTMELIPTPSRPASATGRARSVDPLGGPELGRTLPRSASRSRERSVKDSDVLVIARNKDGKHRVKDSPKEQDKKMSSAEGAASLNDSLPIKYPQQQQQQSKAKASRMLINTNKLHPGKTNPLLVPSTSGSFEAREDEGQPEAKDSFNHKFKRSASFGSTPAVAMELDDDRTRHGRVGYSSPLSPTHPDLLLEEYRKIGLEIQDLIKNAEDLDNARHKSDGQSNSGVGDDDRNLLNLWEASPDRNGTPDETQRRVGPTTPISSGHISNPKMIQPAGQTGRSSSAGVPHDKSCTAGAPQINFSGMEKDAAVERSRCKVEATNRNRTRTRSCSREPVKEMSLPRSSSVTRNQPRALSSTNRSRNRAMDEDCESRMSKRTGADIRFDSQRMGREEEDLVQHRSRTTFARNRDKGLSRGSGESVSDATRQNAVSTPLRKPRTASNSRPPSTEPDQNRRQDVTSLHAADDIDLGLSTNLDDYCRKALLRKDIVVPEQKRSSRIPMPVEVKQRLHLNNTFEKGCYGYGQLKRFDSGVDINSNSPLD